MSWSLSLDKPREWPAGRHVEALDFRSPTLRDMRSLPEIEIVRRHPDGSTSYGVDWAAVEEWLKQLVTDKLNSTLIEQLSPAEAERAKAALLGFFTPAEAEKPRSAPPTTSASAPASAKTRIE